MKLNKMLMSALSIIALIGALLVNSSSSYADGDILNVPQNISIETNNSTSTVTVSWEAPSNINDFQDIEYIITESPDGQTFTTTETSKTFENLSIGEHSFSVKARGTKIGGPPQTITQDFSYTGNVQAFTAPYSGDYKLEVWGAQGGTNGGQGGKGGYSLGTLSILKNSNLYVYIGQSGGKAVTSPNYTFNGGAKGYDAQSSSGGGATDIRLVGGSWDSNSGLNSRIIVAGGGGGGSFYQGNSNGGIGGGLTGGNYTGSAYNNYYDSGRGALQTGSNTQNTGWMAIAAGFGLGGVPGSGDTAGSGGGGGWYGGSHGIVQGGGGGSGYILTSSSYKPSGYTPNSSYWMTNAQTIAGNQTFKSPAGTNETGHSGNGYARITFQGSPVIESTAATINAELFEANLNITNIDQTGTNVSVSWSIDSNYENVSYKISDDVSGQTFDTSETSYTFQNLSKGLHNFTIKAFNEENEQIAEASEDFSVSTVPSTPNITVTQNGFNQAKVSWSVDDDGGSSITSYKMMIDNSDPIIINSGETSKIINVSTGTHEIKLSAINTVGKSDYATSSITIKQLPSQVQNLQVVKSSKTVTVSWTPPMGYSNGETGQGFMSSRSAFVAEGGTDEGIEYIVESIPSGYSQTTDGTSVTFDLDEGDNTDYQFKVTPMLTFGEGIPNYTGLMSSSNNMGEVNIFVESSISLTLNDDTVDLSEIPGSTNVVTDDNEMNYTVTTNNLEGYTVTIKADNPTLNSSIVGNTDNIPVDLITVSQSDSDSGTGSDATALSSTNDNQLYSQNKRSVESGDSFNSTFNLTEVPWVNADDYTGTVTYTATAN